MFERFTEPARQVVVLAQDEARALGHDYIGTEHLLLGLLREGEGLGARALSELGVTLEDVRERVRKIVGTGNGGTTGQIPFTPRAKKTLELALREGQALGHNTIGTEHILLGLARQDEGVAGQVLLSLGADVDTVRRRVIRLLGGPSFAGVLPAQPWPAGENLPRPHRGGKRGWYFSAVVMLVAGWLLFAFALGAGVLVGWAIWG